MKDDVRNAIINGEKIEPKLHTIVVISNAVHSKRREQLFSEFVACMENTPDVLLYLVEMVYGNEAFHVTQQFHPRHLQLRTEIPLFHKENMINLAVEKLFPKDWKAFAWIDADLEFDNPFWATETLKILNGHRDIVQLFSHVVDMDPRRLTLGLHASCGYQYEHHQKYNANERNLDGVCAESAWPGYAWAMRRHVYERVGGLYEKYIFGGGDNVFAKTLADVGYMALSPGIDYTREIRDSIMEYQHFIRNPTNKFGYVHGVIYHHYHGNRVSRGYYMRELLFKKWTIRPNMYARNSITGVMEPTNKFPEGLKHDILHMAYNKNEDANTFPRRVDEYTQTYTEGKTAVNLWFYELPSGYGNFGNELSFYLVSRLLDREQYYLTWNVAVENCPPGTEQLVLPGSYIHMAKNRFHIWGSGILTPNHSKCESLNIHCVRGPLTCEQLGISNDLALGDPALLLPDLVPNPASEFLPKWEYDYLRDKIAFVTHHSEYGKYLEPYLKGALPPDIVLVNPTHPWKIVVGQIIACRAVIASSLHGLICADAYGKPNCWFEDRMLEGDDFKFRDYFMGQGRPIQKFRSLTDISESDFYSIPKHLCFDVQKLAAAFPFGKPCVPLL